MSSEPLKLAAAGGCWHQQTVPTISSEDEVSKWEKCPWIVRLCRSMAPNIVIHQLWCWQNIRDHGSGQICRLSLKASPAASAAGRSRLDSSLVSCRQAFLSNKLLPSFCISAGIVLLLISQTVHPITGCVISILSFGWKDTLPLLQPLGRGVLLWLMYQRSMNDSWRNIPNQNGISHSTAAVIEEKKPFVFYRFNS